MEQAFLLGIYFGMAIMETMFLSFLLAIATPFENPLYELVEVQNEN